MRKEILHYDDLFFWMGCFNKPKNPNGLPNQFPFTLELNTDLGLLSQKDSKGLQEIMHKTYQYGSTVGNAMDDSPLGQAYCHDFLNFCDDYLEKDFKILEIGAGRGYMASLLAQKGHDITALEPGEVNKPYWKKFEVNIIQDLFPSDKAQGPYDVIIFYGVLEHICNMDVFLSEVKSHLKRNGKVLISVPDCELELKEGDPSMLLHEHYHYFSSSSLNRCAQANGFKAKIIKSDYGRSLYAVMEVDDEIDHDIKIPENELSYLKNYGENAKKKKDIIQMKISKKDNLGIYIPARLLALFPQNLDNVRFFDDAEDLHGKYYPPFSVKIENRNDLFNNPPETIWVMSKTFGANIKEKIDKKNIGINVLLPEDILEKY